MSNITEKDLNDLRDLLMELIWMPNKADANPLAARIRHKAHNFEYQSHSDREMLFKAIDHAEAAGDARRKEYWIREYEPVWFKFETSMMNKLASRFVDQGIS